MLLRYWGIAKLLSFVYLLSEHTLPHITTNFGCFSLDLCTDFCISLQYHLENIRRSVNFLASFGAHSLKIVFPICLMDRSSSADSRRSGRSRRWRGTPWRCSAGGLWRRLWLLPPSSSLLCSAGPRCTADHRLQTSGAELSRRPWAWHMPRSPHLPRLLPSVWQRYLKTEETLAFTLEIVEIFDGRCFKMKSR